MWSKNLSADDAPSEPLYSFVALCQSDFHLPRAEKLEFYEDAILIYRFKARFTRDSEFLFLRTAEYSDVLKCQFIEPRVAQASNMAGFTWAEMPGGASLSMRKPHPGKTKSVHHGEIVNFTVGSRGTSYREDRMTYAALCDKILAEGGKI
jgi:hypothetical protein